MKIVKQPAAFAALSELRTHMDEILAQLKKTPVTLERHGKPVAVLVDFDRFTAMDEALEEEADLRLGREAKRRMRMKGARYYTLEEVEKRFL